MPEEKLNKLSNITVSSFEEKTFDAIIQTQKILKETKALQEALQKILQKILEEMEETENEGSQDFD